MYNPQNITNITKVFIIDDDPFFGNLTKNKLEANQNLDVQLFLESKSFVLALGEAPDILVIDYDLPGTNGIKLLQKIKEIHPYVTTIFLSGQKELQVVVDAYKNGADRYIIKNENALIELEQNILFFQRNQALKAQLIELQNKVISQNRYESIIGDSMVMHQMFRLMQRVENVNIPVLITGQNGTGKEMVANALHYNSDRKRQPFVAINVAAIPEDLIESELFGSEKGAFTGASRRQGKFEEANNGTIFLDEIGEMPLNLQAKLLRVLQENKVTRLGGNKEIPLNIKIISATNKDLWEEVQKGNFREDLYFRLQGFILKIPSLKERENDIIHLAKHFIQSFTKKQGLGEKYLSADAIQAMMNYSWPGNVRELKSMVERAALISDNDRIDLDDLIFLEQSSVA